MIHTNEYLHEYSYHHQHNCCPMGGSHCKHTCRECGVTYCCKCNKEFGCGFYLRQFGMGIDSGISIYNATNNSADALKMSASCTNHGHTA